MATAIRRVREQIAFYGSTPSYHQVLELHGWEDVGRELNTLSRNGSDDRWVRMGELIDDDILAAFAIVAEPDQLGGAIAARYSDVVDRFNFYAPYDHDPDLWKPAIDQLSHLNTERPSQ